MAKLLDLVYGEDRSVDASPPLPLDPFSEPTVFQEATMTSFQYWTWISVAAFLLDLRTSLYYSVENVGLLVLRGASQIQLQKSRFGVWVMGDTQFSRSGNTVVATLQEMMAGEVRVEATSVEVIVGIADSLPNAPAALDPSTRSSDFVDTIPAWHHEIQVTRHSTWGR